MLAPSASQNSTRHYHQQHKQQPVVATAGESYDPAVIKLLESSLKTSLANRQITIQSFRLDGGPDIDDNSQQALPMAGSAASSPQPQNLSVRKHEEENDGCVDQNLARTVSNPDPVSSTQVSFNQIFYKFDYLDKDKSYVIFKGSS